MPRGVEVWGYIEVTITTAWCQHCWAKSGGDIDDTWVGEFAHYIAEPG